MEPSHTQKCSVEACTRTIGKHGARGLCKGHYDRWQIHGDPGTEPIKEYDPTRVCSVTGCQNRAKARGWCNGHYVRWFTHGEVGGPLTPSKPHTGTSPYTAAHQRVAKAKGRAADYRCADCLGPAAHWAYDHTDPDEQTDVATGRLFSVDPAFYMPLCVPCHSRFDREWRREMIRQT